MSGLQKTVEQALKEIHTRASTRQTKKGKIYKFSTQEATTEITIGDKWIGYELHINKSALGKEIGTSEDTDHYPIGDKNTEISKQIFDEAIGCLKALIKGEVYLGYVKGKPALALPVGKDQYRIIVRKGRFSGRRYEVQKTKISQSLEQMRSVK